MNDLAAKQFSPFLEALPYPAFLLSGGTVAARNSAAGRLLPDGALPLSLSEIIGAKSGPMAFLWDAPFDRSYQVSLTPSGEYSLLLLQPNEDTDSALKQSFDHLSTRLRQLSSSLFSASKLLASQLEEQPNSEKALRYLCYLNQGHYRLRRIIGNLSDPAPATFTVFDIGGFCRNLTRIVTPLAEASGLRFRYESSVASQLTAGDLPRLERMLLNLFSNAFKYSPPNGEVLFRMSLAGNRILLSVTDQGPGIPPEVLASLFRRYTEWDPADPGPTGFGLGLPVAHRIARQHGGTLMVESHPAGGVIATVSLPLKQPDETLLRDQATPYEPPLEASRVLLELSDALPAQVFSPLDLD